MPPPKTLDSVQILVRGARKSLLTDFSLRMGPLLVRLTLEKWAMSRLTIIFSKKGREKNPIIYV